MSVKSRDQPGVLPHKKTRTEIRDDKDSIGRNRYRILYHVVINTTRIDCTFCTILSSRRNHSAPVSSCL